MDAIKLLKIQHEEVKELFKAYENASDDDEKDDVFAEIADNLAAHSTIEEKLFYPAVYVGELADQLKEAVEEHLSAKRVIADLLSMDVEDENFDAKVKVLKEQIEHHVEEEENELFKAVKQTLSNEELETLGVQMEQMFEQLMAGDPREDIPKQTAAAAPLP
jgi:hemerythrin-like domain-containing protein